MLYKLRRAGNLSALTVPPGLAAVIPFDARFACELNEDGVLFRFMRAQPEPEELPSWAAMQAQDT